ncbi:MAG: right-handed parallel beta-helix repeat-containing protein, partial [Phycisphaerae bacterium]|nr:right-handed parallel beta-helix repeat-containing protein [Phycisphaerae bacterium]
MRFVTTSTASFVRSTLATTLFFTAGTASAVVRNVPAAFPTIQDAINAAAAGDTVLVAAGTYHEQIDFLGKEITVKASSFADPTLTVIDADFIDTAVRIDGGVGPDAKLIGFTIKQGSDTTGGGLDITGDPEIKHCIIKNCDATLGGGAYVNGNATFIDCQFISNEATGGGAMSITGNVTVEDCLFDSNHATGGGAVEMRGICTFADCDFLDNDATSVSSANVLSGTGLFDRCTFDDKDGEVLSTREGLYVSNSIFFSGDVAVEALSISNPVLVTIVNCTIYNGGAAGIELNDLGFPLLALVSNSIIGSNTTSIDVSGAGVTTLVARSNVQGGWPGVGNIDTDPQFVDALAGDLQLRRTSPCIDAGSNALVPAWVTSDLDGNARYVNEVSVLDTGAGTGPIVDMGAIETVCDVRYVNVAAAGANNGTTWTDAYTDLQDAMDDALVTPIQYVLVAQGTYQPDRGTNNRNLRFPLVSGTQLIGGFAGGEVDISERDALAHQTVLSGAIGAAGSGDNSYNVVAALNVDATGGMSGFIVQKGNANGPAAGLRSFGGGIVIQNGAPVIRDCWVRQNESLDGGSGLFALTSDVTIESCRFNMNVSTGAGSAILLSSGQPSIVNTLVHGNDGAGNGAVSFIAVANGLIVNSTIVDNISTAAGCGGVYIAPAAALTLRNSILWKNAGLAGVLEQRQLTSLGLLDVAATSVLGWTGGFGGAGNDGNDPAFVNPLGADLVRGTADDDYRLLAASNAIDNAMSNWLLPSAYTTDLDGTE